MDNRSPITRINKVESDYLNAKYGLPQGGNLSPTFSILYTNDIFELPLAGQKYAYADDLCILYSSQNKKNKTNVQKDTVTDALVF